MDVFYKIKFFLRTFIRIKFFYVLFFSKFFYINFFITRDGVNDSPSIKQADVGVTTSSSSQIAQVSGDILIHKGGLETLSEVFNLSKKSKHRIYQNLFLAFIYNTLMIPIAVVGLITPNLAALAMALSSISVVINSSRKL